MFRRKLLCPTVPKTFVGGPLYSRNVLVSKFFWIIGVSRFCRFFLSHTAENIRRGTLLCFTKWYPKTLWKRGGGEGVSYFSVKNFWSKCQKFPYGNPLVRHYFRVSKNFMLMRVMSRFNIEIFLSHSTKKSLLQHFGVGKLRASKKLFAKGGSRFSVDNFLSHSTEKNCRNNSVYRKTSGIEKTFCKGGSLFSIDNFWSHRTEKLRKGTLVFQKIFDILKISKDRRGVGYHDFVDFFCLTLPKTFVEEQFCVSQSGIQKFYGKEGGGRSITFFCQKFLV